MEFSPPPFTECARPVIAHLVDAICRAALGLCVKARIVDVLPVIKCLTWKNHRKYSIAVFNRPNFPSGAPKSFAKADQIRRARSPVRIRAFESRVRSIKPRTDL